VGTNEAPALAADASPTSTLDATEDGEAAIAEAVVIADVRTVALAGGLGVAPAAVCSDAVEPDAQPATTTTATRATDAPARHR
jgi:molybdopterin biosynthesis enzyme MoaB